MAYNGSHGFVDVPALGRVNVPAGEPIEIDDETLRGQLRRQGWNYVHEADENDEKENG